MVRAGPTTGPPARRDAAVAHVYAVRLALVAFATTAIQGVVQRADFESALRHSLAAAAAFYALGWICGELGRRIVEESVPRVSEGESSSAAVPSSPSAHAPGR